MKINRIFTFAFLITLLVANTSCSGFLDVNPKDQIGRDEVLKNQQRYYDALNGVYLILGSEELFGHQLTYGLVEQMARNHAIKDVEPIFFWQYHDAKVSEKTDAIWTKMYTAIANANSILDEIDNNKPLFDKGFYELLKAELLTIRAYAHYTLVKLYAPDYNLDKTAKGIPYRTVYKDPITTPFSSVEQVYDNILADLKNAEILLQENDPAVKGFNDYQTGTPGLVQRPTLMENRRLRFNYWANIAIQARVYQSMNNYEKAGEFANKIIAKSDIFPWVKQTDVSNASFKDVMYFTEVISGINVSKLTSYYYNYFATAIYVTSQDQTDYVGEKVYETATIGAFDYRHTYLFLADDNTKIKTSLKYRQLNTSNLKLYNGYTFVPTVKLGEMYLIAAEAQCHLSGDLNPAIDLIDDLRLHRGNINKIDRAISKDDLLGFILREFRRELYLEGQLFYQYKRLNLQSMPDLTEMGRIDVRNETYILPIPLTELDENN